MLEAIYALFFWITIITILVAICTLPLFAIYRKFSWWRYFLVAAPVVVCVGTIPPGIGGMYAPILVPIVAVISTLIVLLVSELYWLPLYLRGNATPVRSEIVNGPMVLRIATATSIAALVIIILDMREIYGKRILVTGTGQDALSNFTTLVGASIIVSLLIIFFFPPRNQSSK